MALIDKETICKEIERRIENCVKNVNHRPCHRIEELCELLAFLDTLPEQAAGWDDENASDKKAVKEIVKTVHKEVTRQVKEMVGKQPLDIPSAGSGAMGEIPPKFKLEVKEQPVDGLEDEIEFEIGKYMTINLLKKRNHQTGIFHLTQKEYASIARHFAEWGAEHLKQ